MSTAAPLAVGFTVTVIVAVAPAARLPSEHVTVPFPAVQLPWLVVDDAYPAFFGSASDDGPRWPLAR